MSDTIEKAACETKRAEMVRLLDLISQRDLQIKNLTKALQDACDALELEVGEGVFKNTYGYLDEVLVGYRR